MTSAEFAARLNVGAGAAVWTEGVAEDPRWVYVIESGGSLVRVLDLSSRDAELVLAAPHRLILTAVMQNGLPWVSARFLDFSGTYRDVVYEAMSECVDAYCEALGWARGTLSVAHSTVRDDFDCGSGIHRATARPPEHVRAL